MYPTFSHLVVSASVEVERFWMQMDSNVGSDCFEGGHNEKGLCVFLLMV